MSNTCPNMAQILGSLDVAAPASETSPKAPRGDKLSSQTQTPSHISANTSGLESFSFSKTQKIDFKDQIKNIFNYVPGKMHSNAESYRQSKRENSAENKFSKLSPLKPSEAASGEPLIKSKKHSSGIISANSKRSRGSHGKYSQNSGLSQGSS